MSHDTGPDEQESKGSVRSIRLADRFYLPRRTWSGAEVHDVMPWDGATEYVTDGFRYGVRFPDRIWWFSDWRVEQFAEDFQGIDLDTLVEGLRAYSAEHGVLQRLWSEDLKALEELRSRESGGGEPEHDG
jgi:hypothetical protein